MNEIVHFGSSGNRSETKEHTRRIIGQWSFRETNTRYGFGEHSSFLYLLRNKNRSQISERTIRTILISVPSEVKL